MDYTSRYGMDFNPFIKNSNEVVMETSEYNEIIFRLNYLLDIKGFGVLTGEPGRGKTTTIRSWVKGLNTSLYKVVYSPLSTLTVAEFYKHFATELGLESMSKFYRRPIGHIMINGLQKHININNLIHKYRRSNDRHISAAGSDLRNK
jgi:type II secretory pathway predicted ATPase ExeA